MIELPKSCGINLNLNNLSGELTAQISGYLNLDLGTPAGLASLKGTLESGLNTLKGKLTDLIPLPDLPNIPLKEMKDQIKLLSNSMKINIWTG